MKPFAPVPVSDVELVQEMQLGELRFTESWHAPSSIIARHAHRRATLTILADGAFEERYRFRRNLHCDAPAIHIRPPGEPHTDHLGPAGAHNLVFEIDQARIDSIADYSDLFADIRHLRHRDLLAIGRRIQRELLIADAASPLALEGMVLELIGTASRNHRCIEAGAAPWLERVYELLHDRFREQSLRLSELAAIANVHPVHLARAFRRRYGMSPGEYLRQLRVEWAAREIRGTERFLAEVAAAAGFADQSHLSRVFKAHFGVTPGAWRRRHANQ